MKKIFPLIILDFDPEAGSNDIRLSFDDLRFNTGNAFIKYSGNLDQLRNTNEVINQVKKELEYLRSDNLNKLSIQHDIVLGEPNAIMVGSIQNGLFKDSIEPILSLLNSNNIPLNIFVQRYPTSVEGIADGSNVFMEFILRMKILSHKNINNSNFASSRNVVWVLDNINQSNVKVEFENVKFGIKQLSEWFIYEPDIVYSNLNQDNDISKYSPLFASLGIASLRYPKNEIKEILKELVWRNLKVTILDSSKVLFDRSAAYKNTERFIAEIKFESAEMALDYLISDIQFQNFNYTSLDDSFVNHQEELVSIDDKAKTNLNTRHTEDIKADVLAKLVSYENLNANEELYLSIQTLKTNDDHELFGRISKKIETYISDSSYGLVYAGIFAGLMIEDENKVDQFLEGPVPVKSLSFEDIRNHLLQKYYEQEATVIFEAYDIVLSNIAEKNSEEFKLAKQLNELELRLEEIKKSDNYDAESIEVIEINTTIDSSIEKLKKIKNQLPELKQKLKDLIRSKVEIRGKFESSEEQEIIIERIQLENDLNIKEKAKLLPSLDQSLEGLIAQKNERIGNRKSTLLKNIIITASTLVVLFAAYYWMIKHSLSLKYLSIATVAILSSELIYILWRYKKDTTLIKESIEEFRITLEAKKHLFQSWIEAIKLKNKLLYEFKEDIALYTFTKKLIDYTRSAKNKVLQTLKGIEFRGVQNSSSLSFDKGNFISVVSPNQIENIFKGKKDIVSNYLENLELNKILQENNVVEYIDSYIELLVKDCFSIEINEQRVGELFEQEITSLSPATSFEVYAENLVSLSRPLIKTDTQSKYQITSLLMGYLSEYQKDIISSKFSNFEHNKRIFNEDQDIRLLTLFSNISYLDIDPTLDLWKEYSSNYSRIKKLGDFNFGELHSKLIFRYHDNEFEAKKYLFLLICSWLKGSISYNSTDQRWHLLKKNGTIIGVSSYHTLEFLATLFLLKNNSLKLRIEKDREEIVEEFGIENSEIGNRIVEMIENNPRALVSKQVELLIEYINNEFGISLDIKLKDIEKITDEELELIAKKIFEDGNSSLTQDEIRITEEYQSHIDELIWELEYDLKNKKSRLPDPVVLEELILNIARKLLTIDVNDLTEKEKEIYNANRKQIELVLKQLNNKDEVNEIPKAKINNEGSGITKNIILSKSKSYIQKPKNHSVNSHVNISSSVNGEKFTISFTFKDHKANDRNFNYSFLQSHGNELIDKYGVPKSVFESYYYTSEEEQIEIQNKRDIIIKDGLFKIDGDYIIIDEVSYVKFYLSFAKPVAEYIVNCLKETNSDTTIDRVRFTLSMVQDIPYGVPSFDTDEWLYQGVATPPEIMLLGFGDCDSKSFLFASILSFLIPLERLKIIKVPHHCLTAIKVEGIDVGESIDIEGEKYLLTEVAGPGRKDIGDVGKDYQVEEVISLDQVPNEILP